jgi:hypothetical protein
VIAVARKCHAHRRIGAHQVAQALRDRQRDVLLVGATPADRPGILAAMPGVDRHRDDALYVVRPGRAPAPVRVLRYRAVDIAVFQQRAEIGIVRDRLFAQQREQRIGWHNRVQIEQQPVPVRAHRVEREYLRLDVFL